MIGQRVLKEKGLAGLLFAAGDLVNDSEREHIQRNMYPRYSSNVNLPPEYSVYRPVLQWLEQKPCEVELEATMDKSQYRIKSINGALVRPDVDLSAQIKDDPGKVLGYMIFRSIDLIGARNMQNFPADVVIYASRYSALMHGTDDLNSALGTAAADYENRIKYFTEFVEAKRLALANLEEIYASKLKLQESRSYFNIKYEQHGLIAASMFFIFICTVVLIISSIVNYGPVFIEYSSKNMKTENSYIFIAFVVGSIGSVAWVLRIVSKVFSQNLLLWSDAKQRSVMIATYLALQKDGGVQTTESERIIVLNAIFRPVGDQREEDISPPTLADLLTIRKPGAN